MTELEKWQETTKREDEEREERMKKMNRVANITFIVIVGTSLVAVAFLALVIRKVIIGE